MTLYASLNYNGIDCIPDENNSSMGRRVARRDVGVRPTHHPKSAKKFTFSNKKTFNVVFVEGLRGKVKKVHF